MIKDFLHYIGFHGWYYSKDNKYRSCVRCGIVQRRGDMSKKYRTV